MLRGILVWTLTVLLLIAGAAAYIVACALIWPEAHQALVQAGGLLEVLSIRGMQYLIGLWVLVFGASIGSFLNVVVYRLPRGMPLIGPSICPRCASPIRPYDNVPVVGWFALGGRCRDCDAPISRRYPLIETLTGLTLVALFVAIVGLGGEALPLAKFGLNTLPDIDGRLFGAWLYHAALAATLIAWAGMAWDRQPIPLGLPLLAGLIGVLLPILWPTTTLPGGASAVHPLPPWPNTAVVEWAAIWSTLLTLLLGLVVGTLLALTGTTLRGWLGKWREPLAGRLSLLWWLPVLGLFVGWQLLVAYAGLLGLITLLDVAWLDPPRREIPTDDETRPQPPAPAAVWAAATWLALVLSWGWWETHQLLPQIDRPQLTSLALFAFLASQIAVAFLERANPAGPSEEGEEDPDLETGRDRKESAEPARPESSVAGPAAGH